MNVVIWLLAGAATSWIAWSTLHLNGARGLVVSLLIGTLAAFFGGHILSPLLGGEPVPSGEFNPFGLVVATASAVAVLKIADMVSKRFEV